MDSPEPDSSKERLLALQSPSSSAVLPTAIESNWTDNGGEPENNYGCVNPCPFHVHRTALSGPIYGVVSPPVILFTVVTNSLICAVLLRPNMRTATNALLLAMALSDMMTGLWPLPCYVYFHTFGAHREWVPYRWCFVYQALTEHLPTVFHTASIWLTVALAVHRYVCVCRPQAAKSWCTITNVVMSIVGIYVASCLTHASKFFEYTIEAVELPSLLSNGDVNDNRTTMAATTETVFGCRRYHVSFIVAYDFLYYKVYYWFRVIFIHLVPCSVLVVFNALLLVTMHQARRRRRQLLAQNRRCESRRLAESNLTTMMLMAVVGVFLLVEFPLALLLIVHIIDRSTDDLSLLDDRAIEIATLLVNTFILLSYPINFFIYCGMSQQFRDTFKGMFGLTGSGASGVTGGSTKTAAGAGAKAAVMEVTVDGSGGNGNGGEKVRYLAVKNGGATDSCTATLITDVTETANHAADHDDEDEEDQCDTN